VANDDKAGLGPIVVNVNKVRSGACRDSPTKGLYEIFVTARAISRQCAADRAVMIDVAQNPVAMTRLATTEWQRLPVGVPFNLEAGKHVLSLRFRNSFASGPQDRRCLYLAKFELLRLDQVGAPALASNAPGSMMMQQAATMEAQPLRPDDAAGGYDASRFEDGPAMQDIPCRRFSCGFADSMQGQRLPDRCIFEESAVAESRSYAPRRLTCL